LLTDDRAKIPLAPPKPVIVRPEFLNAVEGTDNLGLTALVRAALRDQTEVSSRGGIENVPAIFRDASDIPASITPSGIYTVMGKQVSVKLRLSRDNKVLHTQIVAGSANDLPGLAVTIVTAILDVAKAVLPSSH
jgi:hypothetical protein